MGVTPVSYATTTTSSTTYTTVTVSPSGSPTTPAGPFLTTFTPGTYTIPATTITLKVPTTVAAPTTTVTYGPGTYSASYTVVTIVATNTVYYCPFSSVTPTSAPVSSSAAAFYAPSSSAAPTSSSSAAKPSSSSSSGSMSANGNQWCQTYSPYTSTGTCKDAGSVSQDIATIAGRGFTCVRIYSTDCSGLTNVGTAVRANNMKMIVGVFISNTGISGAQQQVSDLTSWAQWDIVELVVVGNEAIFNGYCSASDLAGFITSTKSALQASGYNGPCTTTETLNIWQDSGNAAALTAVVDGCGANIHAFFNADTTADQAGTFVLSQIQILEGICGSKPVWNCETGWPYQGSANGAAVPGIAEQQTAISALLSSAGKQCVVFDSFDAPWKAPGEYGVEQYWGTQQCEW